MKTNEEKKPEELEQKPAENQPGPKQEEKAPAGTEVKVVEAAPEVLSMPVATPVSATELVANDTNKEKTVPAATFSDIIPNSNKQEEPKRGRGRPKGSTKKEPIIPPADFADVPKGETTEGAAGPVTEEGEEQPQQPEGKVQIGAQSYENLAQMIFDTSTGIAQMTLGPEWAPRDSAERAGVVQPLARYLETQELKDIPPGVLLTMVVVAYSAPRITQPSTKARLAMGWLWLKSKFQKRK